MVSGCHFAVAAGATVNIAPQLPPPPEPQPSLAEQIGMASVDPQVIKEMLSEELRERLSGHEITTKRIDGSSYHETQCSCGWTYRMRPPWADERAELRIAALEHKFAVLLDEAW